MSDPVIILDGGPHPNATIYSVSPVGASAPTVYEIRDGSEALFQCAKLSYLQAILPLVQSGE